MKTRPLGKTGAAVSIVGLGAGPLGDTGLDDDAVHRLVHGALDLGVTLFDTARSYGASEDRLGYALGERRKDVVIATKGGYGVDGAADWTSDAVRLGIDRALGRLRTDVLDVFFLHSCPLGTLVRDDLREELDRAKRAGKIRFAGYSGENDALAWAIASGSFDVVECSVSPVDRHALETSIPGAAERGLGVLAKRPLANAVFRQGARPEREDLAIYWDRMKTLGVDLDAATLARFAAHAPGVSSALVGTTQLANLEAVVRAAAEGPLDEATLKRFADAWNLHASGWPGVI
jgi:aryl-alcohol dehydrogenase-like predicted oxidoreductase